MRRSTCTEFAKWLGTEIIKPYLSDLINGKSLPREDNVAILAKRLRDDICDYLSEEKLDFRLEYIKKNWENLSEELRKNMEIEVRRYFNDL